MRWFYYYECTTGCNLFGLDIGSMLLCNLIGIINIGLFVYGATMVFYWPYLFIKNIYKKFTKGKKDDEN